MKSFFHFRSKQHRGNIEFRKKYLEGWTAWVFIRRVELAIEANGQLLLQVCIGIHGKGTITKTILRMTNWLIITLCWGL